MLESINLSTVSNLFPARDIFGAFKIILKRIGSYKKRPNTKKESPRRTQNADGANESGQHNSISLRMDPSCIIM